jgi:glycosyltransferase involved in cell wall biosynthesis
MTVGELDPKSREKSVIFSQVGVDLHEIAKFPRKPAKSESRIRLLSVGRLVHWKGFALGIKAFALFNQQFPNSEFHILGDGPERAKLEDLVSSMGLSRSVHLPGMVSRKEYLDQLIQCNILVYTGLHEPGAYVIAEAMAARLPVICLDFGEPASIVTRDTGIKVPMFGPEGVVIEIAHACLQLATNRSLCDRMGEIGRCRVLEFFEWNQKGSFLASIYEGVLQGQTRAAKVPGFTSRDYEID